MLMTIIWAYLALIATIFIHEIGHFGKKIYFASWFPIPVAASLNARLRYGGIFFNAVTAYIIFKTRPDILFLQLLGLFSWLHVVIYLTYGSFNKEKVHMIGLRAPVYDDVDNKYWYIFVPLGITLFLMMYNYFIPVMVGLF